MLHWLRKNVSKKYFVCLQLFTVSAVVHSLLLCLLFVWARDKNACCSLTFSHRMSHASAPIILAAHISPAMTAKKDTPTNAQSVKLQPPKKPMHKKPTTTVQKTTTPPKQPLQRTIAHKKKEPPSKIVAKQEQPKAKNPVIEKPKKTPQLAQKKESQKPAANVEHAQQLNNVKRVAAQSNRCDDMPDGPILVAKDYREKALLKKYQLLQQELSAAWKPPLGVGESCSCQLRVHVNSQGAVRALEVTESSGVLLFDGAARFALYSAQLPKWTWGKELDITFS